MTTTHTVLVIEDDESINLLIRENLKEAGFNVISAFDGVEGLKAVEEHRPNLIILDILLPKLDGWEVYRRLRQGGLADTQIIPVIIVSILSKEAELTPKNDRRVVVMGKPFDVKHLIGEVRKAVEIK